MPYRVLIDGTKLLDRKTDGIKRYVLELLRALASHADERWVIDVALSPSVIVPLKHLAGCLDSRRPLRISGLPSLLSAGEDNPLLACKARLEAKNYRSVASHGFDVVQLQALRLARSGLRRLLELKEARSFRKAKEYDLIHLTLPNTWKKYAHHQTRFTTTVHDLSHLVCPELQSASNIKSLKLGLEYAQLIRSQYISVSHSTAAQLEELMQVAPANIHVVHEGVDQERFASTTTPQMLQDVRCRYQLPSGRFLLSLGTIEPRKNLLNTVRAFHQLVSDPSLHDARLVIAGCRGWGEQEELEQLVNSCPQIRTIGYVEEADLSVLYAMCTGFCYISHYEGFGLPVAEAMSCGAAVIYGDNSSMPEVAKDGGMGVDSNDVSAIASAMRSVLVDPSLRTRLSERAVLQASRLTWRSAAEKTLQAYLHCLTQNDECATKTGEPRFAKAA
jgi:glycosyltransferase involved in cell wall biosynthesis